jgi:hypothetical protein
MKGLTERQAMAVAKSVVYLGLQARELQHLSATGESVDRMREKMLEIMETAFQGALATMKDVENEGL